MAFDELQVVADCNESTAGQAIIAGSRECGNFTVVTLKTPRGKHDIHTPLVGKPIREISTIGIPDSNRISIGHTVMIEVIEEE